MEKGGIVLLRESPAIAQRPFTAPPDTTPFRSAPWVNDSIRVEGFITGCKPGNAVYHYGSPALFGFEDPNTPMTVVSMGRFRVPIPSTHAQIHVVRTDVAAEPDVTDFDQEIAHLPSFRKRMKDAAGKLVFVWSDINGPKWRNTVARLNLIGKNTIHYRLPLWQVRPLSQNFLSPDDYFLLFDKVGKAIESPVPKPSEEEVLIQRIDELIGR